MKTVVREDESGISEVIGTILILAMTVVLFSVIIIWVSSIPTPVAQSRLDVQSQMVPIYILGVETGVNITLTHLGGEALQPTPTVIYVTSERGSNPQKTDIVRLHLYNKLLGSPNGLVDGRDSVWSVGERWAYKNTTLFRSSRWAGRIRCTAGTTLYKLFAVVTIHRKRDSQGPHKIGRAHV